MKAVILAAGEGQRMRPLTASMPKSMIPIAGKPLMEYVISACVECGIRDFVAVVGYGRQKIQSHFEDGSKWGVRIQYVFEEKQLGTGHALKQAKKLLENEKEFLVLHGDGLFYPEAIRSLTSAKAPAMLVKSTDKDLSKYGVVSMEGGRVTKIAEKPEMPESTMVNAGAYHLTQGIFKEMDKHPGKDNNRLTDLLRFEVEDGAEVRGILVSDDWKDAIYPWDLLALNRAAAAGIKPLNEGIAEQNVILQGNVKVGKGTRIHPNTCIVGPVTIGEGCEIGPNAVIYSTTSIGNNVTIAPFCEVVESIIMDDVRISTGSIVHSSIISSGVAAGIRLSANRGEADVQVGGEWHHIKSLGAIIGEDTKIGDNVTIKPGAIVGAKCKIARDKFIRAVNDNTVVM
ncbi:MAG: sugar phosphate nucleotidyltransferase [Candidatus Thermoplasmatota archaeon]|nr:sugar phosphate nucleotidyltransferase [Candidatus Thermoplasmatota archaeon]